MNARRWGLCACATSLVAGFLGACSYPKATVAGRWSPKAAAAYLDEREHWWMEWSMAARDHETFCVSCHTALPYALSRAALRRVLAEEAPSVTERRLLENVTKRVHLRTDAGPYYSDQKDGVHKTAESRGTEAILNALIVSVYDAETGRLSDDARAAFDQLWAVQEIGGGDKGAWSWLDFGLRPWEANESQYYGAALAAAAVGTAPQNYRSMPTRRNSLELLREYLVREYATQSLFNRTVLLWASTKLSGILGPERRASLIAEILAEQRSDGGWSLTSLNRSWKGSTDSDSYATGLITFTLQQAGLRNTTPEVKHALSWLEGHQDKSKGFWASSSLNKERSPTSNVGRFMSDAATAYAVLALAESERQSQ